MLTPSSPNARTNATTHAAASPSRICGRTIPHMVRSHPAPLTAAASSCDTGTYRALAASASAATGTNLARYPRRSMTSVPYTAPNGPGRFHRRIRPTPTIVLGTANRTMKRMSAPWPIRPAVLARAYPSHTATLTTAVAPAVASTRLFAMARPDPASTADID